MKQMKCNSLSLSGNDREKLVKPKNASTIITTEVNSKNHCQKNNKIRSECEDEKGVVQTGRNRMGMSYFGIRTRWDRMIAFAVFQTYLRAFLGVEDGEGDMVGRVKGAILLINC